MRAFLYNLIRIVGCHDASDGLNELQRIGGSESGQIDLFERFLGKNPIGAPFEEIAAVRPRVQAALAAQANGVAFIKTRAALGIAGGYPTIDIKSSVGAIYIVRNPLDIAASLAMHFGFSIDDAIDRMCLDNCVFTPDDTLVPEFWGSWSQNVASWTGTPNPRIKLVRYEDMLSTPEAVLRSVADFAGQIPDERQLAEAIHLSSFGRLKEVERKYGFSEAIRPDQKFFRRGRAGGWRTELNTPQIRRIVAMHHIQMRRVGYLTSELAGYVPAGGQ